MVFHHCLGQTCLHLRIVQFNPRNPILHYILAIRSEFIRSCFFTGTYVLLGCPFGGKGVILDGEKLRIFQRLPSFVSSSHRHRRWEQGCGNFHRWPKFCPSPSTSFSSSLHKSPFPASLPPVPSGRSFLPSSLGGLKSRHWIQQLFKVYISKVELARLLMLP